MEAQLKEVFAIFDKDDSGSIDAEELKQILDAVSSKEFSLEEVGLLIESVDHGEPPGEIGFREFLKLISN